MFHKHLALGMLHKTSCRRALAVIIAVEDDFGSNILLHRVTGGATLRCRRPSQP